MSNGEHAGVSKIKTNPDVLFKRLGDEIVLFHLGSDRFYELNGTAARFWELLQAGHDTTEVRKQMVDEFAVSCDQFDAEAEVFVASLQKEDLVTIDA